MAPRSSAIPRRCAAAEARPRRVGAAGRERASRAEAGRRQSRFAPTSCPRQPRPDSQRAVCHGPEDFDRRWALNPAGARGTRTRMPRLIPPPTTPRRDRTSRRSRGFTRHAHEMTPGVRSGSASNRPSVEQLAIDSQRPMRRHGVATRPMSSEVATSSEPPLIAYSHASIAGDTIDKRVVHTEAPRGHRQQRTPESLDKRHQHARGRLRGPESCTARIDQHHRSAADREFVRNRLADDARPDDRDVAIWHCFTASEPPLIISRRWGAPWQDIPVARGTSPNGTPKALHLQDFRRGWLGTTLAEVGRGVVFMEINRAGFGALAVAGIVAAGGGAYLANRHADVSTRCLSTGVSPDCGRWSKPKTDRDPAGGGGTEPAALPNPSRQRVRPPAREPTHRGSRPARARPASTACRRNTIPAPSAPPTSAPVNPPVAAAIEPVEYTTVDTRGDAPQPPQPPYEEFVIPADSVVGLQIDNAVTTDRAKIEDRVSARVTRDVKVRDYVAIPAGARAEGSVTLVERGGRLKDQARLGIRFHTIVLADGTRLSDQHRDDVSRRRITRTRERRENRRRRRWVVRCSARFSAAKRARLSAARSARPPAAQPSPPAIRTPRRCLRARPSPSGCARL